MINITGWSTEDLLKFKALEPNTPAAADFLDAITQATLRVVPPEMPRDKAILKLLNERPYDLTKPRQKWRANMTL